MGILTSDQRYPRAAAYERIRAARSPALRSRRTPRSRSRRCGRACAICRRRSRCCPGTSRRTARTAPRSSRARRRLSAVEAAEQGMVVVPVPRDADALGAALGQRLRRDRADQLGRPFALWPIHPERVQVCRATEPRGRLRRPIETGDLFYEVERSNARRDRRRRRRLSPPRTCSTSAASAKGRSAST
jgi:hypothetical protein